MKRLQDKVAVITGAGAGMGRLGALHFAKEGAKVIVTDVDEESGKSVVKEVKDNGGEAAFIKTDVSQYEEVEAAVDFAVETFGTIDIMYNNAGLAKDGNVLDIDLEDYHNLINIDQHGVLYGIKAAANKMKDLNVKGVIINTASTWGIISYPNNIAYNMAKAAVIAATQTAGADLGAHGIRVVGTAPGTIKTDLLDGFSDEEVEGLFDKHMRKDGIEPQRVIDVVTFLASDESDAINGVVVPVDDGYTSFKG
ncbi:SDR family oxidoreductase [Alkalibacterium iburiense]|uniref:SDR family oxidoreductase n=1 Tax=Alkalibacterium iburiense TaxID=290589 RepID=A0ABN0X5I6_9LACT